MADEPSPMLTVVVPAYNEEANLGPCVRALLETFAGLDCEVVIVDDGSADGTRAEADRLVIERPDRVRVLAHAENRGFGATLRTGFDDANGRHVTYCPADFRIGPEEWAPFAGALGRADVIVGRRRRREGYNALMQLNAWIYPRLVRLLFGLDLGDVNWICVYRADLMRRVSIECRGIPMLVEMLVKLRDLGATFLEVDCRMQPRTIGTPSASRPRVMWRTLAGLLGFWRTYRRTADPSRHDRPIEARA